MGASMCVHAHSGHFIVFEHATSDSRSISTFLPRFVVFSTFIPFSMCHVIQIQQEEPLFDEHNELRQVPVQVGTKVDVMDQTGQWTHGTIVGFDNVEFLGDESNKLRTLLVKVSYTGWGPRWDEWLNLNSYRLAPFQSVPDCLPRKVKGHDKSVRAHFSSRVLADFLSRLCSKRRQSLYIYLKSWLSHHIYESLNFS